MLRATGHARMVRLLRLLSLHNTVARAAREGLFWLSNCFAGAALLRHLDHLITYSLVGPRAKGSGLLQQLTDDIRLPFSLGEKRKLRAARGSGITATIQPVPFARAARRHQSRGAAEKRCCAATRFATARA